MDPITGHYTTAIPASWAARTLYDTITYFGFDGIVQPTVPNGYVYGASGGTSDAGEPTWPTVLGGTVMDGTITWTCFSLLTLFELGVWDQMQVQGINGDTGGCYGLLTPMQIQSSGGGAVSITGPTVISNGGSLKTLSSAIVRLAVGDFPRNGVSHSGLSRRILVDCATAQSDQAFAIRPDFSLNALRAVACAIQFYNVSGADFVTSVQTVPVRWSLSLEVVDGATLADVVLTYQSVLGTPTARVLAVATDGTVTPLTSQALGADVNGYVTAPPVIASQPVQSWVVPVDGGASASNAVVARGTSSYVLEITEDQTQATFPGVLPVFASAALASTGANIDLANAPYQIDGIAPKSGNRILVKDQADPRQNGVYLYPALPVWVKSAVLVANAIGVSLPPNGYYYVCTTAGTGGTAQPTWPITIGTTVADGTAVWTCAGLGTGTPFAFTGASPPPSWLPVSLYAVGAFVQPPTPNGLAYKCTTSGTTAGAQPTWPLTTGATVTDGTAVWTCEGTIISFVYTPTAEIRTYGMLAGAVVPVIGGTLNAGTAWQYSGAPITLQSLGAAPAVPWGAIPTGFSSGTDEAPQDALGIFSAQGNAYLTAAVDHVGITKQRPQ